MLEDLLNARQLDGFRRVTVGQGDLAVVRRSQRLGDFAGISVLLDQQVLLALQGLDLFPVDGHRTGIFGLDQQLAAIEDADGAAQLVTVLQPDGVGKQGRGRTENS